MTKVYATYKCGCGNVRPWGEYAPKDDYSPLLNCEDCGRTRHVFDRLRPWDQDVTMADKDRILSVSFSLI